MSRKLLRKKKFLTKTVESDNILFTLFINRILSKGKKTLAIKILQKALFFLEAKTLQSPIFLLEKAVRNVSPHVKLKAKKIGGATWNVPTLISKFEATNIAIRWLISHSKKRAEKQMFLKLGNEILEASKGTGLSIKKKEETHKMAEANKAFMDVA